MLDGPTSDELGARHGVHRATAARWCQTARTTLRERTKEILTERLGIDSVEHHSVLRLVESQLELTRRFVEQGR